MASGANAVIAASGNDGYVAGHWNANYGVWCGGAWLGGRAHGMTYGAGGELELQASAIKRVTIGNDYATKFYNSSGIATVLINGTAGTITTSNGSGSSVNITTNENAGYAGTPLYTDLNFCGYGGGVNGSIRMSDISASSSNSGPMQFFTRVSISTLERMRISADGNVGIGSTNPTERLSVAGNITASGTVMASGTITSSGYVFGTNGVLGGNSWLGLNSTASYLTGTTIFRSLLDVAGVTIDGTEGTIAATGSVTARDGHLVASCTLGGSLASPATSQITFKSTAEAYHTGNIRTQSYSSSTAYSDLFIGASSNISSSIPQTHITIKGDTGNVGISTSTPSAKLSLGASFGDRLMLFDGLGVYGYGLGIQENLLQIYAGSNTASVSLGYGLSSSFVAALTTTGTNVSIAGHVTSVIQSLSTDPTGADLASGQTRTIKNTSTGTTKVWLNDGGTFKAVPIVNAIGALVVRIDGGGFAITTGAKKVYLRVPFACTITDWEIVADQSGSITIDIWKDTYANFPPTAADTITAAAKPTLSSAAKNQSSALTGWTTSLAAGDYLEINVDSVATITLAILTLKVTKV